MVRITLSNDDYRTVGDRKYVDVMSEELINYLNQYNAQVVPEDQLGLDTNTGVRIQ